MRRLSWVLCLFAVFLLVSCAGLPKPERDSDSLVVGSFVLDYPDGFFDQPHRTLDSNIRLYLLNSTTGAKFSVVTSRHGYFHFLSDGTSEYEMNGYAFNETIESVGRYSGGGGLNYKFSSAPRCVYYVGHLTLTSAHPKMVKTSSNSTGWHFDDSIARVDNSDALHDYLQGMDDESQWLTYDVRSELTK